MSPVGGARRAEGTGLRFLREKGQGVLTESGVVFVLPSTTAGQQGPVASWVSAAGWASAARRVLGHAWVVTPNGLVDPVEARRRASSPRLGSVPPSSWRRKVPPAVKAGAKDVRQWNRARNFRVDPEGPWSGHDVAFVWQRHELFQTAGIDLAKKLHVPSVLFVPATLVWEAQQWGVKRPGWGRPLEYMAEQRAFKEADLIACGSALVAEQAHRLGAGGDRLLIAPTGVDIELFPEQADDHELRRELGLEHDFVVGWVGSFRRFHALEQAIDAVARIDGAALLLVGDGPERARIRRLARARGVKAKFTGTIPHNELPRYLAAMDVGLLLAAPGQVFHYSPLKLPEYLAAGLPVVVPRVSQLADRLTDGVDAVFVPAGDSQALGSALQELRDDPVWRKKLSLAARSSAETRWSWDHEIQRILAALQ